MVEGATFCSSCNLKLLDCQHPNQFKDHTDDGIDCPDCGEHLGYDLVDEGQLSDSDDAVGGTGDYGDRQNPGEN
jgi:DNA-directed RNA polymerase subunit RPC12/RpoP